MTTPLDILAAVRAGRTRRLPELLKPLDRDLRRDLLAALKELRGELRAAGWDRWQERDLMSPALLVAGAACQTGAAAAAAWIGGRDMRRGRRLPESALLDVLADRDPKWLGDLAHRLAARPSTAQEDYGLIRALVLRADCPMPTTDGCVEGWAMTSQTFRAPLADGLRGDPHLTAFVPRLFETPNRSPPSPGSASRTTPTTGPPRWPPSPGKDCSTVPRSSTAAPPACCVAVRPSS